MYLSEAAQAALWNKLRWALLVLAIFQQGAREYFLFDLAYDKSAQLAAARNWLNGQGYGYHFWIRGDLAQPTFLPLYQWPPGYSFLIAPLLLVAPDFFWATVIGDWIGVVIFFVSWFVILESLAPEVPPLGKLVVWLLWTFGIPPLQATSTDLLGVAFFSAGVAACVRLVVNRRRLVALSLLSALCLGVSASMRFAYWPLVLVAPAGLALCARRFDRRLWRAAGVHLCVGGLAVLGLGLYLKANTGHVSFLSTSYPVEKRSWWFENLAKICPFPATAFLPERYWNQLLAERWHVKPDWFRTTLWLISLVVLAAFLYRLVVAFRDRANAEGAPAPRQGAFFLNVAGAITLVLTVGMLAVLSVRCVPPQDGWVFIEEARYYFPVLPFLVVAVVCVVFRPGRLLRSPVGGPLVLLVGLVLAFPCLGLRDTAGLTRLLFRGHTPGLAAWFGPDAPTLSRGLKSSDNPGLPVIFLQSDSATSHSWMGFVLAYGGGHIGLMRAPEPDLDTSKPIFVVAAVPKKEVRRTPADHFLAEFCQRHGATKVGEVHCYGDCNLLQFVLTPGTAQRAPNNREAASR
jgi:hypothetical protein